MKTHPFSLNQVTVSVTNLEKSFDFYKRFGLLPIVKSPHYARFIVPGNEATFSLHIADTVNSTTVTYFETSNIDQTVKSLKKDGFQFAVEPTDQKWLWREAYLHDPDGNKICIYYAGTVRLNPDWRLPESKKNHLLASEHFNEWLNKYKMAWEQKRLDLIEELFALNAVYHKTPFESPLEGIVNILNYWKEAFDTQQQITFDFEVKNTFKDCGIANWTAHFTSIKNQKKVMIEGVFEAYFNKDLKCSHFNQWWHKKEH